MSILQTYRKYFKHFLMQNKHFLHLIVTFFSVSAALHLLGTEHKVDSGRPWLSLHHHVPVGVLWPLLSLFGQSRQPTAKESLPAGWKKTYNIHLKHRYTLTVIHMLKVNRNLLHRLRKVFYGFVQHTTRTMHNLQGKVESRDSGLWINSFDYTGIQYVTPHIPELNDSIRTHCRDDRPFCGYPWFLPVKFLSKSVMLPCSLYHITSCVTFKAIFLFLL